MNLNKRIRYVETVPGVLTSRRHFTTSSGQEVNVVLSVDSKTYRVIDSATGIEVASGGGTKNLSILKIKAKKNLEELGVVFDDEKRIRGEHLG